ncbi:MAG TPA: hypothetical protein DDW93_13000, partial [Firmicutes bacterium]|nr:hypothetical protein [Bacillota bacterium]
MSSPLFQIHSNLILLQITILILHSSLFHLLIFLNIKKRRNSYPLVVFKLRTQCKNTEKNRGFNMSQAYNHVKFLAEEIGPRGSCTTQERKAADYIKDELEKMSFETKGEEFKAVTSFSWVFGFIYLLFIISALIFPSTPNWGFILALFTFLGFYLESSTFPLLSRLIPKKSSQNIIATVPARSKTIRKVIVTAHYDTSRSALSFSPKMVKSFRRTYLLMVGAMSIQVILYALGVFTNISRNLLWALSLPSVIYLFLTLILLAHRELAGEYTPGANDNASGVAVLLEVAKVLARFPLLTTTVTLVATGAEESGTNGALNFLRSHHPPKDTFIINLDNLGIGKLTAVTQEGILGAKNSSLELLSFAESTAEEKKIDLQFLPYNLLTTDGTVFLMRGYPTMTLMAFDQEQL